MKRAFSLIELSIVILIIGILIAGVTQASRLVLQMKLMSARTQTQSAPIAGIKGLMLWLETTGEGAFIAAEAEEGLNITRWNDYSPQAVTKNNVSRVTSNSNIIYKTNGINSLPAVYFSGTTGGANCLIGTLLTTPGNNFSAFIVSKTEDNTSSSWRIALLNGGGASGTGWIYQKSGANKRTVTLWPLTNATGGTITLNAEIASASYDGTNVKLYINGTAESLTPNTGSILTPDTSVYIGNIGNDGVHDGDFPWKGLISEVIVFDSVLRNADRREVEKYLSKKWAIKVS